MSAGDTRRGEQAGGTGEHGTTADIVHPFASFVPTERATDEAGNSRRVRVTAGDARDQRAELDPEAGHIDTTEWFNQ